MQIIRKTIGKWTTRFLVIPLAAVLVGLNISLYFLLQNAPALHRNLVGAAVLLASIVMVVVLHARARRAATRVFSDDLEQLVSAGDWVFRHALGQSPVDRLGWAKNLKRRGGGPGDLIWELEEWLRLAQETAGEDAVPMIADVHRDLELAKEFQQAYLNRPYPRIPQVHVEGRLRLEFYHRYEPALALGGDFFDIVTLAPDCAGVFIADVMGHGTRSALITAILRTLIGDLQHQGRNAPHFLTELNKQFCAMLKTIPNPLFASACYFVPDTTARVATFSSAGHPSPFIVRSYLKRVSRLNVPPPHGSALGLIDTENYTGGHVRLNPGDVFLFFTDGVYEAHNSAGEEFGVSRIEGVINKLIYKGGRAIVDGIMQAVKEFAGDEPVMDDICMVSVEVAEKAMATDTQSGA